MTNELRDQVEWMRLQSILSELLVYKRALSIISENSMFQMVLQLKERQTDVITRDFVKRGIKVPCHLVSQIKKLIEELDRSIPNA